jgi:hypothetical protein
MKAYLISTGTIFGLLAAMHIWRAIDERSQLASNPVQWVAMVALGMVAASLAVWAFRLLRPARG